MSDSELKIVSDKEVISKCGVNLIRLDVVGAPEFDVEDVERHISIYKKFGCDENNKGSLLIVTNANVVMSKGARELSSAQTKKHFVKVAVVGHSLTVRFLVNFLTRFYRYDVEIRLFLKEREALHWLEN